MSSALPPSLLPRRPRGRRTKYAAVTGIAVVGIAGAAIPVVTSLSPDLRLSGVRSGAVLSGDEARALTWRISADSSTLDKIEVRIDGAAAETRREGGDILVDTFNLPEGEHTFTVSADGGWMPMTSTNVTRTFTVDTSAPELSVDPLSADKLHAPVTVTGKAPGAAKVLVSGREVKVAEDGTFSLELPEAPPAVEIGAVDKAGNTTTATAVIKVPYPTTRAAHITAVGWNAESLREPLLDLIRQKKLNTVQLDIKDESGEIGYDSQVPLAREIGASKGYYNARQVIDQLHDMGVRVVGRLVAFRDPVLASRSWEMGHRDRVVQTPSGDPYGGGNYGSLAFTNFANPEVRQYNIDIAVEAASLGFDDILYDYVRRPDGRMSQMVFKGIGGKTPEQSIADFVADTRGPVRAEGAFLGASVFGIAATRPTEIAQDIPMLAKSCDYIAPMVYPSHWGPGEYGVSSPNNSPYDIVQRSLADFAKLTAGTGVAVVPWLQDFSWGVTYGPAEVAAQIKAAADNDMPSFLLWNAGARYQGEALSVQ